MYTRLAANEQIGSRRLLTYRKKLASEVAERPKAIVSVQALGKTANELNNFRKKASPSLS